MSPRALIGATLLSLSLFACGGEVYGDPDSDYGSTVATDDSTSDDTTVTGETTQAPAGPGTPGQTPTTPTDPPAQGGDEPGDQPANPPPPPPANPPPPPANTVPAHPVTFQAGQSLEFNSPSSNYYVLVPRAYDQTHRTPMQLYIYLHGCGGESSGDVWASSNIDADWIGLAPGGAEGGCWDNQTRGAQIVMDAIADIKTHFNIDPTRILIGGYSSGGDLSYYTAFKYAATFAGVLSHNSIPAYRTQDLSTRISGAAWKLPIYHLAATSDGTYAIATVRTEMQMLRDAGFPVTFIEQPGTHYDSSTTPNRNNLLFPHLYDDLHLP